MWHPTLKKPYGQHHLRHGELCRPLIEYLAPAGERVVEIGPGGGVLTRELLSAQARVVACEVDLEWACYLQQRLPAVRTVALDALDLDWRRLPEPTLAAGNLPFQIATRLIEKMLTEATSVPRAAFMVQKEVAERLVAGPGEAAYGSLSVLISALATASYLGTVAPGSFRPPPKVTAAFVGFDLRPPIIPAEEISAFSRLVQLAFGQRRKTLRNALAAGWGRPLTGRILEEVGLDQRCRAESLALETFVELHAAWRRLTPS